MMSGALQGKVLLATDRNGEHNKLGMVLLHMHPTAGHSVLPGLNVTGDTTMACAPDNSALADASEGCTTTAHLSLAVLRKCQLVLAIGKAEAIVKQCSSASRGLL